MEQLAGPPLLRVVDQPTNVHSRARNAFRQVDWDYVDSSAPSLRLEPWSPGTLMKPFAWLMGPRLRNRSADKEQAEEDNEASEANNVHIATSSLILGDPVDAPFLSLSTSNAFNV